MIIVELILGLLLSWVAELGKKVWIDQKYIILFWSLLIATVWYFINPETQEKIMEWWLVIAWSATATYNAITLWKENIKEKEIVEWEEIMETDAIVDDPQPTDRTKEMLYWKWDHHSVPEIIYLGKWVPAQNQWIHRVPSTRMACWSYATWQIKNIYNREQEIKSGDMIELKEIQCHELWRSFVERFREEYKKRWLDPLVDWSYISDQLKFAIERWLIAWYYRIAPTPEEIDNALASGKCICTWSKMINWRATRQNWGKVVAGKWSWHLLLINRKNWDMYWMKNSYWPDTYDWWYCWIHKDQINLLYSMYPLIDKTEQHVVDKLLQKIERKKEEIRNWRPVNDVLWIILMQNRDRWDK